MNRTCARGLGTSVQKGHLQGKHSFGTLCAPVYAPVLRQCSEQPVSGAALHQWLLLDTAD
jgi:hypothetical protein